MADSLEVAVPTMEDIPNMKVAELKKKLKEFGLPITGNKTELIERLQNACFSSKDLDSFESSQLSLDESQLEEGADKVLEDTDLILYNSQPYISSSLEDDSALLEDSEKKVESTSSSSVIMSPKKRVLAQAISDGTGVEKKVIIKRTNVTTLKDFSIKPAVEPKPIVVSTNNNVAAEEKKVSTVKNMSAAERMAMRAKRFNVSDSTVTTSNSKTINIRNSKQSILSSSVAPDLDILKKRAERFGQSVSTVMKQLEHKEKLLKRKCKFGASISATSSLDEQAKKRLRADRFGIS